MIPVLWVLALWQPQARLLFVVLLSGAFLTDQLDGYLCRKYGLSTPYGAKLDRVADDLLTLNTVGWMAVLRPELFREYWPVLGLLLLGFGASVGLQYIRFRRKIPFHLIAGKTANWAIGLFAAYTFLFGPTAWFVYPMAAIVAYALLEEIALVCTRRDLDEHVTSIFARRRGGDGGRAE
jgi:CDP-diacylglycerol--glycerol-3-phosphate 3-phosphatidyltransferase